MQERNGDTDIENRLVDAVGEVKSGTNGEGSIDLCTLPYEKQIAGEKLLCSTGSPGWCSVMTWGEEGREGMYVKLWLICIGVWQKPAQHCKKKLNKKKAEKIAFDF